MTQARRWLWRLGALGAVCLLLWGGVQWACRQLYPRRYAQWVERYAAENGLPEALVYAVIRTESGFDPQAVSGVGARGLMQITEETFEWARYRMGEEGTVYDDLFDPETNIRYGCYILSLLLAEFETVDNALCAYHAGWGRVKGWLQGGEYSADGHTLHTIPVDETRWYLTKVNRAIEMYQRLYRL